MQKSEARHENSEALSCYRKVTKIPFLSGVVFFEVVRLRNRNSFFDFILRSNWAENIEVFLFQPEIRRLQY